MWIGCLIFYSTIFEYEGLGYAYIIKQIFFCFSPLGASEVPLPFLLWDVLVCPGEIPLLSDKHLPPHTWVPKILPWQRWGQINTRKHCSIHFIKILTKFHQHKLNDNYHILPFFRTDTGWPCSQWSSWGWQLQWSWHWHWKCGDHIKTTKRRRRHRRRWSSSTYHTTAFDDPLWAGGTVQPLGETGGAASPQKVCPCRHPGCCSPARGHEGECHPTSFGSSSHNILTLVTLQSFMLHTRTRSITIYTHNVNQCNVPSCYSLLCNVQHCQLMMLKSKDNFMEKRQTFTTSLRCVVKVSVSRYVWYTWDGLISFFTACPGCSEGAFKWQHQAVLHWRAHCQVA